MSCNFRLPLLAAVSTVAFGAAAQAANIDIYGGGSTLGAPTYLTEYGGSGTTPPYCGSPLCPSYQFHYAQVGSGTGTTAFLSNTPSDDSPLTPPAGTNPAFNNVQFGASDFPLNSTQVSSFVRVPSTDTYPMIQVPAFGIAIGIPFVFKGKPEPAVTLKDSDLCGIFSGKITNWNQTSANPGNEAITVVYRTDGSGTSFQLTNHLHSVCTTSNSNITFTATATFASLFSTVPSNFVGESGSGGVRTELLSLETAGTGAVGYIGVDYTSIAPNSPNTSDLVVASLVNATNSTAYQPTNGSVSGQTDHITPALTTVSPPSGKTAQANPVNWGIQVPTPSTGYPLVGYTFLQFSQCYKNVNVANAVIEWLGDNYNAVFSTVIENSGFVTLPNTAGADYVDAINAAFLTNTSGFDLDIGDTAVCASSHGR
jgi:phosphate transport system substrate-binding protein